MRKSATTITQLGRQLPNSSALINSNLKKISEIVRRNNGSELLSELKKIDAFKPVDTSVSLFRTNRRLNRSMTKVVADLYVSNRGASIEKAYDVFDCLQAVLPSARLNGLVDLINACIDKRLSAAAVRAYYKAIEEGFYLDLLTQRRLVKLLCLEGRVNDLLSIVRASGVSASAKGHNKLDSVAGNIHASMLDNCILYLAEPFLMSGCTEVYCDLLVHHLHRRKAKWQQSSAEIAHVISSVIYAKIRRDTYHVKITPSEQAGIHRMLHVLRCYHVDIAADCKASGKSVTSLHSYSAAANLEKLDRNPMIVMDEMFLALLPPVDLSGTNFPFLIEEVVDPVIADAQEQQLLANPYSSKGLQASSECDVFAEGGEGEGDGDGAEPLVSDFTLELSKMRRAASAAVVASCSGGRAVKSGRSGRQQVLEYHQKRRMHKHDLMAISMSQAQSPTQAQAQLLPDCKEAQSISAKSVGDLSVQQRNILYHASLFPGQYADEIVDIRRGYAAGRQRASRMAEVVAGQIMHNMLSEPNASVEIEVLDGQDEYDNELSAGVFNAGEEEEAAEEFSEYDLEEEDEEEEDEEDDESCFDEEDEDEEEGDDHTEAEIIALVNDMLGPGDGSAGSSGSSRALSESGRGGPMNLIGCLDASRPAGSRLPLDNGREVVYDHHRDHDCDLYHDMRLIGFSDEHHSPADGFEFNDLTAGILGSLSTGDANTPSNLTQSSDDGEPDEGGAGVTSSPL